MKRSYVRLAVVMVFAALGLGLLTRLPQKEPPRPAPPLSGPRITVSLEIAAGGEALADTSSVPKGSAVTLRAVNRGDRPRLLSLSGYEDRLRLVVVPGEIARATLRADRPGGDFAWLVDGVPAGRFAVTGSHLDEDSR